MIIKNSIKNFQKKNKKKNNYFTYLENKKKKNKKPKKFQITNYLYINRTLKKGIFFKKPSFNEIKYPIQFNFKLINEFLKKK
jgi:hypothetical protein